MGPVASFVFLTRPSSAEPCSSNSVRNKAGQRTEDSFKESADSSNSEVLKSFLGPWIIPEGGPCVWTPGLDVRLGSNLS